MDIPVLLRSVALCVVAGLYDIAGGYLVWLWLRNLHATLDRAVWDAYGWPADEIPAEVDEDVILGQLLALNLERAGYS